MAPTEVQNHLVKDIHLQATTPSDVLEDGLQGAEPASPDPGGHLLPVAKSRGCRSYCFTSEAGKAVILEEPGGVMGLVSLKKTKKSRGLREMASSVTGTIRRGVRMRRSVAFSWEGTFANPAYWSSTDSISPPASICQVLACKIFQLTRIPGPADVCDPVENSWKTEFPSRRTSRDSRPSCTILIICMAGKREKGRQITKGLPSSDKETEQGNPDSYA